MRECCKVHRAEDMHQVYITIDIAKIVEGAIDATSADFRALRFSGAIGGSQIDINQTYEDAVITADDREQIEEQLSTTIPQIYQVLRAYCPYYNLDINRGVIEFNFEAGDHNSGSRIEPLLTKTIIESICVWWWESRVEALATKHSAKFGSYMDTITTIVIPTFSERQYRMI